MKVGQVIRSLYGACEYGWEENEARTEIAGILREAGWHVSESEYDLRNEALEHTDLVEPGDE